MSLVDGLRDAALSSKKNEIASVARAHRQRLRALRSVTRAVATDGGISGLLDHHLHADSPSTIDADEAAWLKSNDLLNGRYFDPNSLPVPTLLSHALTARLSDSREPSQAHSPHPQSFPSADGSAIEASVTDSAAAPPAKPLDLATAEKLAAATPDTPDDAMARRAKLRSTRARPDSPGMAPGVIAPPTIDEQANLSPEARALVDSQTPVRTAKTVHLPPQDEQEQQYRERREEEEERRKSESEKSSRPSHLHAQNEAASSPSSTVGAYSAATPLPPQESPDTSPDSDSADMEVLPPKDLQPSPEAQRAKEEHDRLLAAQKDIARRQALGDVATPDEQLKWEAREAAARDEEERAAREAVNGPEPDVKNALNETEADQVMEDIQPTEPTQQLPTPATAQDQDSKPPSKRAQDEGDNITVTPRSRLSSITKLGETPLDSTPSATGRRNHRLSSGAMAQILGESPTIDPSNLRNIMMSPNSTPMATRHPKDAQGHFQTPRRTPRMLPQQSPMNEHDSLRMVDLEPLKGAAEDSDRDYLESLFRIQAHDSPAARTKPLPNLAKDAAKYMSTDDHFTTLHERLDYRILRRIYQLQNANKWSLRQMEKCSEPEQPVTHHDHMMSEMKWMRKDFKAERRMKKSVCAWLADRCADWVAAGAEERLEMQVKVRAPTVKESLAETEDPPPDLEASGDSAPEDDATPPTPTEELSFSSRLVVAPELSTLVVGLQKSGTLSTALQSLPVTGLHAFIPEANPRPMTTVSKFVEGKVFPKDNGPSRKRSRYDYEDDAAVLAADPSSKRLRQERDLPPEDEESALFHGDNKHIRDRLHANNAFRPPSEHVMPHTSFYEFRNGSQWIWEDDQKLRKLAKEYSFNWSLISEELNLPSRFKSSAERRTPWECFERWVELETLPAEMRKTMYFKTWFQRLEQSGQASERRYQAQLAVIQQSSAATNGQANLPLRRRTVPSRVEKRKNARYLWLVDAMRKLARKREQNAYKSAETQRLAAQRKAQSDSTSQPRGPSLTPQEFSKRRHERDLQIAEAQRQHRAKIIEAQNAQRQMVAQRAAMQQAGANGMPQQRQGLPNGVQQTAQMQANGQLPNGAVNGQVPQQARQGMPMQQQRNGHLAVPQTNGQGMPQAQMRAGGQMAQHPDMQRMAHANAQRNAQQFGGQQFSMPNGNMSSPNNGLTTQQQLQLNQQLLAQQQQQQSNNTNGHDQSGHLATNNQGSGSPSMPPPPTPQAGPQQLSSGHIPALFAIKNQLKAKFPQLSDEQLNHAATEQLTKASQSQATNQVARQNAMNAAAGIPNQVHGNNNMQGFNQGQNHGQGTYQNNGQMPNGNGAYMNGDGSSPQANMGNTNQSPQAQAYAVQMRARQMAMMRMQQQSPNAVHATLNGSPGVSHASPNMAPASPSMQFNNMAQNIGGGAGGNNMAQQPGQQQQRPPSRSNTPQMQRLGSSGSIQGVGAAGMTNGMQSPGSMQQGSPRNMQANMAR